MAHPHPRSYRCYFTPLDLDGFPVPAETGVLPFVQLKARDAEDAQRQAFAAVGKPIALVERIEPVAADSDTRNLLIRAEHAARAARFAP